VLKTAVLDVLVTLGCYEILGLMLLLVLKTNILLELSKLVKFEKNSKCRFHISDTLNTGCFRFFTQNKLFSAKI